VLYGGWARGADIAVPAVQDHVLGLVNTHWGFASEVLADIFMPDVEPRIKRALVHYQRESATPEVAGAMLGLSYRIDVADYLSRVVAPTLVVHRDRDRAVPLAQGKLLAELIPGAELKPLSGSIAYRVRG
jgi:pimeloyl-ACP methyl ester carboxylesterase